MMRQLLSERTALIGVVCLLLVLAPALKAEATIIETGLNLDLGGRTDKLNWSIADQYGGQTVNVLSELSWKDVRSVQLAARGWLLADIVPKVEQPLKIQIDLAGGQIRSGRFSDRDYAGNNRTQLFSEARGQSDHGYTADLSFGLGLPFQLGRTTLTPSFGYSLHMLDFRLTDGVQVVNPAVDNVKDLQGENGSLDGLDSRYKAYWYGPWIGVELSSMVAEQVQLVLDVEYHWADYFAEANWNLRSDFAHPVSFEHTASGRGLVTAARIVYQLNQAWSLNLNGKAQRWATSHGTDRLFLADGRIGKTRLNRVEWKAYTISGGVQYRF